MIQQLAEQFCKLLPSDWALKSDIKKNSEALLVAFFSKLQLVTREEFEVQSQVLARAFETIHELENKIAQLEVQIQNQTNQSRGEN